MSAGVRARLDRIGTDDRYVIVPMDHGLTLGAVSGLADLESTVAAVVRGGADAVLTHRGVADRVHEGRRRALADARTGRSRDRRGGRGDDSTGDSPDPSGVTPPVRPDAGYVVHLNGATAIGPDEDDKRPLTDVEEAVRAGADAVSVHVNVGSDHEHRQLRQLSRATADAADLGLPVLAMAYARGPDVAGDDPEALAHAVRIAEELGADLIKTAYSGSPGGFERVVEATALPVVIAGGDPEGDRATLEAVAGARAAGAAGVSMGRSIFQHDDPGAITRAVAAVVHEGRSPSTALEVAGLADADADADGHGRR